MLDGDKDGVNDDVDQCPDSIANAVVNEKGCALFKGSLKGVQFKVNSAELTESSIVVLNEVVATLTQYPNLNIRIEAHTDSQGKASYNESLSKQRAASVLDYLVSQGISASRLESLGLGSANITRQISLTGRYRHLIDPVWNSRNIKRCGPTVCSTCDR